MENINKHNEEEEEEDLCEKMRMQDMLEEEKFDILEGEEPDLSIAEFLTLGDADELEQKHIYKYTKKHGWTLRDVAALAPAFIGISDSARIKKLHPSTDGDLISISAHATRLDDESVLIKQHRLDRANKTFVETGDSQHLYTEVTVNGSRGVVLLEFREETCEGTGLLYEEDDISNIYLGIDVAKKLAADLNKAIADAELKKADPTVLCLAEDMDDYE
jgi:hypothetical protein